MIEIVNGNILDSNANFLVHSCGLSISTSSNLSNEIFEIYPHVEKEYLKYIRHCEKNDIKTFGNVQYVPSEVWAMMMADTMKNENIMDYDTNYQYIVNVFGQSIIEGAIVIDFNDAKRAFNNIREKAEKIGASVAIPYDFSDLSSDSYFNTKIRSIVEEVFKNSNVYVEMWRG